ncbi:hypothetical protein CAPTEDRAFT_204649, partial [Capitella teleta]
MKSYFAFVLLAAVFFYDVSAAPQREGVDCTDKEDGVYGWGCWSYTLCTAGEGELIECDDDFVFDEEYMQCRYHLLVGPPCGSYRDCTGMEDGRYADHHVNCTAFYTCNGGIFFGHNPCNP